MASDPQGLPIIEDDTPDALLFPTNRGRGLELELRTAAGYAGTADPFPDSLIIPRSEYQARIEEIQANRLDIKSRLTIADLPCKDQGSTNYCWINAPTHCIEIVRVMQNQEKVILSPASAGAQIKNFSNVGGWGLEGLQFISDKGLVPVDRWPANAISRQYATAENKQLALNYRTSEWWELEPRNMDHLISVLLRGLPVAVGYNWWRHEVTAVGVAWVDGEAAPIIRNSWGMNWPNAGAGGYSILRGNRAVPDDAVAARVGIAA